MKGVFLKTYKSVKKDATGKEVLVNGQRQLRTGFIYTVEGTPEEIERYVAVKGADGYERFDEETGKPLYFSNTFHGTSIGLEITQNDNVVPDTSQMDAMRSLVESQGGNFAAVIEQKAAQTLNMDSFFSGFNKKSASGKPDDGPGNGTKGGETAGAGAGAGDGGKDGLED